MPQEFCSNPKFALSNDLKVGVFCGGRSSERKISQLSGRAVYGALKRAGFSALLIDPAKPQSMERRVRAIDVAFLALHGHGGEDGRIQTYLEKKRVPYVGADAHGSRNAFDKLLAKRLFLRSRIPTPPHRVLTRSNWKKALARFPGPWFIKPHREGSSIGVFMVEDLRKSAEKIKRAVVEYGKLLAEQKISGREFTVGILGRQALPPVELVPKNPFYDFHAKYTKGMTEYRVPARIPAGLRKKLQRIALKVHRCLKLRDLSRIDIMVDRKGRPFVLEANSLPGFTELSLLPKAAKAAGMSFEEVCTRLVHWASQRGKGSRRG